MCAERGTDCSGRSGQFWARWYEETGTEFWEI